MTNSLTSLPVDDATMAFVAGRLVEIGVVSDDDTAWLTQSALESEIDEVERDVRGRGYAGGSLGLHAFDQEREGWTTIAYDTRRFSDPSSARRAWMTAREAEKRRDVEVRADDWISRLRDLRTTVGGWVAVSGLTGLGLIDRPPVRMFERPMEVLGVAARAMPAFDVRRDNRPCLRFQPRGLWILGANGRIDLVTASSSQVLVDRSLPLSADPQWTVFPLTDRTRGIPFTAEILSDLISNGRLP